MKPSSRTLATTILNDVLKNKHSLSSALEKHLTQSRDDALIQEICYGVLRWYFRLEKLSSFFLQKPLKEKDFLVQIILLIGFYQLIYMRIPDHAAVKETVDVAKQLNKPWAVKLLNGVFRSFLRKKENAIDKLDKNPISQYSHPQWLIEKIQRSWPEHWQQILTANNEYPPMTLRVNKQKISRDNYLEKLQQENIEANIIALNNCGLILEKPIDVTRLPGFIEGEVSVQDGAAQLAAQLLNLKPGLRVLDACAAPGGKSAHILQTEPKLKELVALDIDPQRTKKINETLQRLQTQANVIVGDGTNPESWWDKQRFDRILLDAPCSATGVIRRHPDIKLLRRAEDIQQLVTIQRKLLASLWPLLKPGGLLVYATCSILAEENTENLQWFCKKYKNAQEKMSRQILPGEDNMDGFYYACFLKL